MITLAKFYWSQRPTLVSEETEYKELGSLGAVTEAGCHTRLTHYKYFATFPKSLALSIAFFFPKSLENQLQTAGSFTL